MSEMCCTRLIENTGRKNRHSGTIRQLCRAISLQLRHVSTIGKKLVKQQCLLCMSSQLTQYGELQPNSGSDRFVSLGHPCKFHRVSRLRSVTARRHLYSAGRPSRWALVHIIVLSVFVHMLCYGSFLSLLRAPRLDSSLSLTR